MPWITKQFCSSIFPFKVFALSSLVFFLSSFSPLVAGEFYLGLSKNEDSFMVKKTGEVAASGLLASETALGPNLGYKTELQKFWGNWVFFWDISYGEIEASAQEIVDTDESGNSTRRVSDLGTSVKASGISLTPSFLVTTNKDQKDFFFFGLGLGAGYSAASGDIYLNEMESATTCGASTTDEEIKTNCEKHSFNFSGLGLGGVISLGYQGQGWSVTAYGSGPNYNQGDYAYTTNFAHLAVNIEF